MNTSSHRMLKLAGFALFFALLVFGVSSWRAAQASPAGESTGDLWTNVDEATIALQGERLIIPDRYRTVATDFAALGDALAQAPTTLTLPLPDGRMARFHVVSSPIMAPELAAKFPQMTTYAVRGLDDPHASGRVDRTPHGFHAMIFTGDGTVFIDPYSRADTTHYVSYYKHDYSATQPFSELGPFLEGPALEGIIKDELAQLAARDVTATSGDELRTYRTAVAATGEYTVYHGGTVADGMAAIVTAMNRVNGIYEREVAVHMELIANNDLVVYTNGATDPYTNNNGFTMLAENQANLDAVIGNANYDVGHVFSTGGGGVAYLGVPCVTGWKARGVTGLPAPIGDPFYVDYVAHEMGHQFGANHTFNGNEGACSGGNRNASTAYEPGSASTIMGYAGICGSQDLQPNSDDYFHTISFDEIVNYTTAGDGNACPVITATGNGAPVVDAGTGGFTIPIDTPFALTGSATDPDGDPLTYNWEEFDLGPAGHPDAPSGNAPIFRSFPSLTTPSRTFPKFDDLVNNTHTIGELLPTYARSLTFRLTARDNHVAPSAGGVGYDTIAFNVTDTAGPFLVTAPNTAVTWTGNTQETVTWDVANTDAAPVNCTDVDILLSTDGGYTYPTTIEASSPNDGTQAITVPNTATTSARVKVACATNIFFDISNEDFTIVQGGPSASLAIAKAVAPAGTLTPGTPLTYTIAVSNSGALTATTTVTDTFPAGVSDVNCNGTPGDLAATFSLAPGNTQSFTCTAQADPALAVAIAKVAEPGVVAPGGTVTYTITVSNPSAALTLHNVTVADPDVSGCTPALGTPIALGPLGSQSYVCASGAITATTTNTATVTADVQFSNSATASAPEDPAGAVTSNVVDSTVALSNSATASVELFSHYQYLPIIFTSPAATAAGSAPWTVAGTSAAFLGLGILLIRRRD